MQVTLTILASDFISLCKLELNKDGCQVTSRVILFSNNCRAGQATDGKMAHALCMLNAQGYRHTLRICNINCFSTAKMVTRTRLNVTIYGH